MDRWAYDTGFSDGEEVLLSYLGLVDGEFE